MSIIWTIAKSTFEDAIRKKILQIFFVVAVGLIVMSIGFSQAISFSTREGGVGDLMLIKSFGLGLMAVAGLLICVVLGVSLIPQEIERKTIYTILSKPVNRYEFIIGKFIGAAITLATCIGAMGIIFLITVTLKAYGLNSEAGMAKTATDLGSSAPASVQLFDINMVWGIILIYLQFMILSSVVIFFSVFLTPTVNFFMGSAVYIIGTMGTITESIAKSGELGSITSKLYWVIYHVIPNFDKFNVTNTMLHPETTIQNMGVYTGTQFIYSLMYAAVMALFAIIIFEKREV